MREREREGEDRGERGEMREERERDEREREMEMRELLGGTEEKRISSKRGHEMGKKS